MKFIARFLYVPLAGLLVLTSCAKEETESYDKFENQALEAWMTPHRSDLVENLQSEGLYYIDLLDAGDLASDPINTEDIWVSFDFSGRDLSGNIILTRNADDAVLAGSFSKYTHYVPFYRYCGSENSGLMEGTWLAMRRTLTLGDTYFRNNKDRLGITSPEVTLRYGSKIRLYMPSSVVGNGVEGTGGYEGQEGYSLSSKRPFIVTMEIRDTVSNPLEREGTDVDDFCELNGGLQIYSKGDDDTPATEVPEDPEDPEHPYSETSKRWVSACDSIPQVYVNVRYNPAEPGDQLSFPAPYHVGYEPYVSEASVRDIDMQIAEALKKRFHGEGDDYEKYEGVKKLEADSVTLEGTAKIWYIGRFLDGFIFDTNIDEVKQIIYGEVRKTGSAHSYDVQNPDLITAFYYIVPHLKYGQWATLVTTSTNAYGTTGKSGGSSTSTSSNGYTSSYYDYLNYLNYSQMYYGNNGYYGGYYNDYYGYGGLGNYGYYGGYYGGYGGNYDSGETTTTTKVYTDIPSFSPLIFQIYIEPDGK